MKQPKNGRVNFYMTSWQRYSLASRVYGASKEGTQHTGYLTQNVKSESVEHRLIINWPYMFGTLASEHDYDLNEPSIATFGFGSLGIPTSDTTSALTSCTSSDSTNLHKTRKKNQDQAACYLYEEYVWVKLFILCPQWGGLKHFFRRRYTLYCRNVIKSCRGTVRSIGFMIMLICLPIFRGEIVIGTRPGG